MGRHLGSDIFLDEVTVSRKHAEFRVENDEFHVVDLGSLNGTYVNRQAVDSAVLANGDEVQIGKFRLIFLHQPRRSPGHSEEARCSWLGGMPQPRRRRRPALRTTLPSAVANYFDPLAEVLLLDAIAAMEASADEALEEVVDARGDQFEAGANFRTAS